MKNSIELGLNRSGLATSPRMAPQVLQVPQMTPKSSGDAKVIANERVVYARDSEPVATMPPPGSLKELASTTMKLLKGQKALVFVDKVAERMAFERGGTRLYEALLSKYDAFGSWEGGPSRADLEGLMRDELSHFHLLAEVMSMLGADATAVTPSAEVSDLLASGLRMVLSDPRRDLGTCLEAMLQAELTDNDAWHTLVKLAGGYNETQLVDRFQRCLDEERVHLSRVRGWLSARIGGEAFGNPRALHSPEPWVQGHHKPSAPRPPTGRGRHGRKVRASSPARGRGNGKTNGKSRSTSQGRRR